MERVKKDTLQKDNSRRASRSSIVNVKYSSEIQDSKCVIKKTIDISTQVTPNILKTGLYQPVQLIEMSTSGFSGPVGWNGPLWGWTAIEPSDPEVRLSNRTNRLVFCEPVNISFDQNLSGRSLHLALTPLFPSPPSFLLVTCMCKLFILLI